MPRSLEERLSDEERRQGWRDAGALDARGNFKQHLVLFTLKRGDRDGLSTWNPIAFPWVPAESKPNLAELEATWHLSNNFEHWPLEWSRFWYEFSNRAGVPDSQRKHQYGPYWMLLPSPSAAHLAQAVVSMKRRIANELFAKGAKFDASLYHHSILSAMEPFLCI